MSGSFWNTALFPHQWRKISMRQLFTKACLTHCVIGGDSRSRGPAAYLPVCCHIYIWIFLDPMCCSFLICFRMYVFVGQALSICSSLNTATRGGGVLSYIRYIGMCRPKGYSLRRKRFRGVWEQRKAEERDFRCFSRRKIGRGPKHERVGWGRGTKEPPPPPLSSFWLSRHFSRGQNTENPISLTFFAPQPHGNACYAGFKGYGF